MTRQPPTADEYRRGVERVAYCLKAWMEANTAYGMANEKYEQLAIACVDMYENELRFGNGVPNGDHVVRVR